MRLKLSITYTAPQVFIMGFLLLLAPQLLAQQDSQFSQYMYNTETINPAYAGSRGVMAFTGLYRTQWVGLDGAPETFNFTFNTPVGESKRIGLGLTFVKDQLGPADESTIAGDFSYTIPINQEVKLGFGLKAGINLLNVDYSLLNIHNPNDELQQFNIDNRLTPLIGAGLYLHNDKNWYMGFSVPNFLETTHYDDSSVSNASEKAALYTIGGYVFDLSDKVKLKPAVLGKFVSGAPIAVDLSASFMFNNSFSIGAAYRLDAAFSGLAGFQVNDGLLIGYAYDYGIQDLSNYNSGSHEIFLRFELFGEKAPSRFLTPRFF